MDAFYASIEQLDHPEYKSRPVIVGADPRAGKGRGVVAACSYEARKFGIRSALPISRAWRLCPQGVYVRPRMDRYVEVSHQVTVVLQEDEVDQFLRDLPISRLWGVGPKTEARLHEMGFRTIGQLALASREPLVRTLGSLGEHLYQLSHGKDDRPVVPDWERKSVGTETTFDEDTDDRDLLLRTILELSDHVAERLRKDEYHARTVTLKLREWKFSPHTKQHKLCLP